MSQTLNRTMGEQSGNAKCHLDAVQALCRQTLQYHETFNEDLTKLTNEMSVLKEKVKKNPHDLRKFFVQKISPVDDTLVFAEESQKQQNRSIQQLMTEIKRENRETSQAIVKTFQKLKHMQIKIGNYV